MSLLSAPQVLRGDVLTGPATVVIDEGRIVEVLDGVASTDADHTRLRTGILTPGLVDLQVNGLAGVDLASDDDWTPACTELLSHGVTSFLPTLVTDRLELLAGRAREVLGRVGDGEGARVVGVHVEGPFLSPLHGGAHDTALLIEPSDDALDILLEALGVGGTALVTVAPEVRGGLEAVRRLANAGVVVSIGHTDADAATLHAAADAGATLVTHLFNAQSAFHHREPGASVAALVDERLALGLIVDGHHLADDTVRLAFAAAPARIVLVSDAVAAAGMPPGSHALGGAATYVQRDGEPPRRADGTLAGSALFLDEAVRNVVALGIEPARALTAATRTPADVLARHDLGRVERGARADLVHWDDGLHVSHVWLDGRSTG